MALLNLAERRIGPQGEITRFRRTIPGYVARVSRRHLHAAAQQAVGTEMKLMEVKTEPLNDGSSWATMAVVRHTVRPSGHTFIRKSIHATLAEEVRLYRSGLVADPGRWFRAPTVLAVRRQGKCWHLFLEDLPVDNRPRSAADFVNCARGLAELGARFYGDAAPELDWLTVDHTFELHPYERGVRACAELLDPAERRRLLRLFDRLCAKEADLTALLQTLPQTLCHGDAHAGNMMMDPSRSGRITIIDWQLVHLGPAGRDLGRLMSIPSNFARKAQLDPDACRQAYLERLGAPRSDHDAIDLASNATVVWQSLRWWANQIQPNLKWMRPTDVNRVCQAAESLLAS